MEELFSRFLTASFQGSIIIAVVLLLRPLLGKAPRKYVCLLWMLVGLRLLLPFEIPSRLSLQPQSLPVAQVQFQAPAPTALPEDQGSWQEMPIQPPVEEQLPVTEQTPVVENLPAAPQQMGPVQPAAPMRNWDWMAIGAWVWAGVVGGIVLYSLLSYLRLRRHIRGAIRIRDGLWVSDRIETAFILGYIKPQIYIPMGMSKQNCNHILAHEQTHLEKGDHWFKLVAFLALAIHWFNPLVWVAYVLLCRDIEMACDERVVQFMDVDQRKNYSAALLACSSRHLHYGACPVAFGEVSVKDRIRRILRYKQPSFWITLAAVVAVVFVAVCFVTSRVQETETQPQEPTVPVEKITVSNVDELLSAIGSNREILLEEGTYSLTDAADYRMDTGNPHCQWAVVDGTDCQLQIRNVKNMTIRGAGRQKTTLETMPRTANVLYFTDCVELRLEDLTLGHTLAPDVCAGGVLYLERCSQTELKGLGLFGCGTVGLGAQDCNTITVEDCDIYDCSQSAVNLRQSHDVTLSNSRITGIGSADGPYNYFNLIFSHDSQRLLVENCEFTNNKASRLLANFNGNATLRGNRFQNNSVSTGAFFVMGFDTVVWENNQFTENRILRWYERESQPVTDEQGNALWEEDLDAMYGTPQQSQETADDREVIHVATVEELLAAIGPNREIVLDAADYNLSDLTRNGVASGEYYYWLDNYDGPGLIIRGVENLAIRGATGDRKAHTISVEPRYADVLEFQECSNITLSGFTAGHTLAPGECLGGVLSFQNSDFVTVEDCGLFGCGIRGIWADSCGTLTARNNDIYECSQGGISLSNCIGVTLEGNSFRDIGGIYVTEMYDCSSVMVDGVQVLEANVFGTYYQQSSEQQMVEQIREVLIGFCVSYSQADREGMKAYLSKQYAGPETLWDPQDETLDCYWSVTVEQVKELLETGKLVYYIEIPVRNTENLLKSMRRLEITLVQEDDSFKIQNCVLKNADIDFDS